MENKAKQGVDAPSRVVILGGGRGGLAMLKMLRDEPLVTVIAIVDVKTTALGMMKAQELGVQTFYDVETALQTCSPCIAFNLTGNDKVAEIAADILGVGSVIGGMEARLIWHMVIDLQQSKQHLEYLATHDELTGLYNRRYVMGQLEREVSHAMRYGMVTSLALLDLDRFKQVNDMYGHVSGDIVLKHVSKVLQKKFRASDVVGRWGGEEFLVLLSHTSEENAIQAVKKCLDKLKSEAIELLDGTTLYMSFSAGVVSLPIKFNHQEHYDIKKYMDACLEQVDLYLYTAKHQGRSSVVGGIK